MKFTVYTEGRHEDAEENHEADGVSVTPCGDQAILTLFDGEYPDDKAVTIFAPGRWLKVEKERENK